MRRWTPFIPGMVLVVALPLMLVAAGQSLHPWRLLWLIPLGLAAYCGLISLLLRLKP